MPGHRTHHAKPRAHRTRCGEPLTGNRNRIETTDEAAAIDCGRCLMGIEADMKETSNEVTPVDIAEHALREALLAHLRRDYVKAYDCIRFAGPILKRLSTAKIEAQLSETACP